MGPGGRWRNLLCGRVTRSLTRSLAHSLTRWCLGRRSRLSCKTATLPPFGQRPAHLNRANSHLKPKRTFSDTRLVPFIYKPPLGGLFFLLAHIEKWRLMQFLRACLGFISNWATATQGLLVRRGRFISAGDSQWNRACGKDVAGLQSPGEG